jgi:hypothetical protein
MIALVLEKPSLAALSINPLTWIHSRSVVFIIFAQLDFPCSAAIVEAFVFSLLLSVLLFPFQVTQHFLREKIQLLASSLS